MVDTAPPTDPMIAVFMLDFCPRVVKAILCKRPSESDQVEQNRILSALIPLFIDQITRPSNAFTAQCRRIVADSGAPFYYTKTPPCAHYASNVREFLKTDVLPRVTTFISDTEMDFSDFMSLTNLFACIESHCDPGLIKKLGAAAFGRLRAFLGKADDNFLRTIAHSQVANCSWTSGRFSKVRTPINPHLNLLCGSSGVPSSRSSSQGFRCCVDRSATPRTNTSF
jgi:hypothetical protein